MAYNIGVANFRCTWFSTWQWSDLPGIEFVDDSSTLTLKWHHLTLKDWGYTFSKLLYAFIGFITLNQSILCYKSLWHLNPLKSYHLCSYSTQVGFFWTQLNFWTFNLVKPKRNYPQMCLNILNPLKQDHLKSNKPFWSQMCLCTLDPLKWILLNRNGYFFFKRTLTPLNHTLFTSNVHLHPQTIQIKPLTPFMCTLPSTTQI